MCLNPHFGKYASHNSKKKSSSLLAGGGIGAICYGDEVLRGLLRVAGFLAKDNNTTILGGLDTNGLVLCG